jgi:hypothetical protein
LDLYSLPYVSHLIAVLTDANVASNAAAVKKPAAKEI